MKIIYPDSNMQRKQFLFEVFTQKNKIILSSQQLDILNNLGYDPKKYEEIAKSLSLKYKQMKIETEELLNVINENNNKESKYFAIIPYKTEFANKFDRIKFLRTRFDIEKSEKIQYYGFYLKNVFGEDALDIEDDIIQICLQNIQESLFLCPGMYIGIDGYKQDDVFIVNKLILPEIMLSDYKNQDLVEHIFKLVFCSFNKFVERHLERLQQINCDILIISGSFENQIVYEKIQMLAKSSKKEIIVVSDKNNIKQASISVFSNTHKIFNLNIMTSPCRIQFGNFEIIVIEKNIYKKAKEGFFIDNDVYHSFHKSFLSQYSYDFEKNFKILPKIFLIGQNSLDFISKIENILICSVGGDEFTYIEYNDNDICFKKFENE